MKKIKILTGSPCTGKTKMAQEYANGKNAVWLDGRKKFFDHPFALDGIDEKTELIVIDDLTEKYFIQTYAMFLSETINIDRLGKKQITIKTPEVIITTNVCLEDLLKRCDIIKF